MKCPNCEYKDGWGWEGDDHKEFIGEEGDFYELPVKMEQMSCFCDKTKNLYACPKCKVAFIE